MQLRNGKLVEAAKAVATDRRQKKEKYRKIRRWVLDKYQSDPAKARDEADVDGSDADSATEMTASEKRPRKRSVWKKPAFSGGQPGPRGLELRGMLGIAKSVYVIADLGFDKMSLYDHISYILSITKDPETPLPKAIVTREAVVMAQHQQHLARENLGACLALRAVMANFALLDLKGRVKTCQNCLSKFRPASTRYPPGKLGSCYHGPCEYHPGALRSWNDALDEEDTTRKLGGGFLSEGKVKLEEFKLWISTCYWDCCNGKLLEVDPEATKRSQRKKRDPLKPWEIPREYDGRVGCEKHAHHIAIQ